MRGHKGALADCRIPSMRSRARFVPALLGLAFIMLAAAFGPRFLPVGEASPLTNPADFRAFYCAGRVVASGADAYRVEPLRGCEQAQTRRLGLAMVPGLVTAAPLPPYALAVFAAFSAMPYPSAVCAWFALLLLATAAAALALRKSTQLPVLAIAPIFTICAFSAMLLGQLLPIVAFLVVAAADALAAGRRWVCAGALALAMIEPHVALPACLAVFAARRELRLPLLVSGLALLVPSLFVGGARSYVEYFGRELPIHALSETHALQAQYSLTTLLASIFGVPGKAAVLAGELDYLAMVGLGLFVALRIAGRTRDMRYLLFIPPAFAALGGMFSHVYTFYIVLPAAVSLAATFPRERALPYWLASAGIALSALLDAMYGEGLASHARAALESYGPDRFASEVTGAFQSSRMPADPGSILAILALKLPLVAGLAALVAAATGAALSTTPSAVTPRLSST